LSSREVVMKMLGKTALLLLIFAVIYVGPSSSAVAGQEIIVSAASSLAGAFTEIGKGFESATPGVKVLFNFGASGVLLQQLAQGAPVDVFASADLETMDRAYREGLVAASSVVKFAGNRLVLITPGASSVKTLKDLGRESVKRIAIGKPESVPAGRYAKETLETDGLWGRLGPKLIYAGSVRQALDYVSRGEVDAGFVYASDAALAPDSVTVACEVSGHRPIVYPVAAVSSGKNPRAAGKFIKYVLSGNGQAVLARYGFTRP
jgi:molybdate transport system substrate-binding protein